jgi:hypothetical protein
VTVNVPLRNFHPIRALLSAEIPWKLPLSQHPSDWRAPGSA